ncbi:DUF2939 domain-containing protein [Brevundimonas aurifodinae]|uniref:DUF2939 domain-containing protein n=2 Tax=Brevundimonas TaxID=41275 RepID=A0ABV1NMQ5_9CAUL|nr:MAG: hypothetical protein B7Z42_15340 [Brevundimonas sp. 12-68-7]OYX32459.1 MAG: hypothetical protein B7Z01_11105 [Brevundimonas subvibrioides]
MKGWVKGLLALAVVAVAAAYLAMPILTVRALVRAAETGDEAALERLVDFPAFRESLKEQLTARLMAGMREDPRADDSALAGLGMLFGPMLVDGAVDVLVTPQAIAAMVETAEAPEPSDAVTPSEPEAEDGDIRKSYAYRDLNTFVVGLTDPDRPEEPLKLLLKRDGLFGWKLAAVELPDKSSPE